MCCCFCCYFSLALICKASHVALRLFLCYEKISTGTTNKCSILFKIPRSLIINHLLFGITVFIKIDKVVFPSTTLQHRVFRKKRHKFWQWIPYINIKEKTKNCVKLCFKILPVVSFPSIQ